MSEQTQRMPPHQEALFAPLTREDLPSFVVLLPDLRVVAATPACAAFGVETGAEAPLSVKIVAKRVAMSLRRAPRLERVRLPGTQAPLPFACIGIHSLRAMWCCSPTRWRWPRADGPPAPCRPAAGCQPSSRNMAATPMAGACASPGRWTPPAG